MERKNESDELVIANKQLALQNKEKAKRAAELVIANKELAFQNGEKKTRATELIIANKELVFQNQEKEKRAAELAIANKELAFQNSEKEDRAAELIIANKELVFQNGEKEKRAAELVIANKELVFQNEEKQKRNKERKRNEEYTSRLAAIVEFSDDAIISKSLDGTIKSWNMGGQRMFGYTANEAVGANISLIIPPDLLYEEKNFLTRICRNEVMEHWETVRVRKNGERFFVSITMSPLKDHAGTIVGISKIVRDITFRKKSEEQLVQANIELLGQNKEKEKRAAELIIANEELAFQNEEKEKRAAELIIANKELAFQNKEKEKRAAELIIANKELAFQNEEKEKRAGELFIANEELLFQNDEKEKRAGELIIANKELLFQNEEKEKRAAELIIANKELAYQNEEKEKRAAELIIANKELLFQNEEKEKRAMELVIANEELLFQNSEKEKQALQLEAVNNELESFSYSVSHDLRAPLRAINGFTQVLLEDHFEQLDDEAKEVMNEILENSNTMGELIDNLLAFSRVGKQQVNVVDVKIKGLVDEVIAELKKEEPSRKFKITVKSLENIKGDRNMLKQVFINLISNAFKYTGKKEEAIIEIGSRLEDDQCTYYVKDNGAGFDMKYYDKLFGVFQRLHSSNEFEGNGVGLAIIQKIISKHSGKVWAEGKVDEGACFFISLPVLPDQILNLKNVIYD